MRFEIRITGFGGQGVVTAGRIVALTAMKSNPNLNAIYVPSYGFATRGGEALSDVILDENAINYPKVVGLDVLVALSQSAFNASVNLIKEGGLIIIDSNSISDLSKLNKRVRIINLEISEAVRSVGSSIFTSTVILGLLINILPSLIREDDLISILKTNFPQKYLDQNLKALMVGKSLEVKVG